MNGWGTREISFFLVSTTSVPTTSEVFLEYVFVVVVVLEVPVVEVLLTVRQELTVFEEYITLLGNQIILDVSELAM